MSEHHPKNVSAVLKFCPTCNRKTMHRVDFKREGSCTEHKPSGLSKEQEKRKTALEKAEREPTLF
jgi:ribosomal protein L44E